jgi:hypothetical protein
LGYNVPQLFFFANVIFFVDVCHIVAQSGPQMKLTEILKVRLSQDTMRQLTTTAKKQGLPVSIVMRRAISFFLANNGPQNGHNKATTKTK